MEPEPSHPRLSEEALALVASGFKVLSEPRRLRLLQELEAGERSVSDPVRATGYTQSNVSRHLQTLAEAGMLERRKDGLSVYHRIADPTISELCRLMCGSLQRLLARRGKALEMSAS